MSVVKFRTNEVAGPVIPVEVQRAVATANAGDVSALPALRRALADHPELIDRLGDLAARVTSRTLTRSEPDRIVNRLGPDRVDHLLSVLPICYRFTQIGAEIFDNARLLAEGVAPPPKFTDYPPLCAASRGVYDQMSDDV